jgi:hypothetical protein
MGRHGKTNRSGQNGGRPKSAPASLMGIGQPFKIFRALKIKKFRAAPQSIVLGHRQYDFPLLD